jgi:hypothetical protein
MRSKYLISTYFCDTTGKLGPKCGISLPQNTTKAFVHLRAVPVTLRLFVLQKPLRELGVAFARVQVHFGVT